MTEEIVFLIIWIVTWIIIGYLTAKAYFWLQNKKVRKDAVSKSKSVVTGQVNEKIAPILPDFPYNFRDLIFVGKWVDYIVFDWLNENNLKQIVFLEIKTWKSNLNKNEKSIKNAIDNKNVSYEILKLNK